MRHDPEEGALVLADISGFTEFVTATEIEHAPPIIAELLEAVIGRISPPLEIQEVEGDAVFALGPDRVLDSRQSLLDVLENAVAAFRRRRQELAADESCGCGACRSVGSLDLKIVVHHGRFLRHEVGGRSQAAGADVILTHRLLKNGVPSRGYLLLTEPALRWAEVDPARGGLRPHVERYEHLGEVVCFVKDLSESGRRDTHPSAARAA
jgi:class 3 adenylate cyclase